VQVWVPAVPQLLVHGTVSFSQQRCPAPFPQGTGMGPTSAAGAKSVAGTIRSGTAPSGSLVGFVTGASLEPLFGLELPELPPVEGSDPWPDDPPPPDAESRLPSWDDPPSAGATYLSTFAHALRTRHATTGHITSRKRGFTILIMVGPPGATKVITRESAFGTRWLPIDHVRRRQTRQAWG
jgi:hypothetical protein